MAIQKSNRHAAQIGEDAADADGRSQILDSRRARYLDYVGLMTKVQVIGQFEQVVLTAIVHLDTAAYGVPIHGVVSELSSPRRVSLGAVYTTLDRLEDKGLVASRLSDPMPERGGRSRRYYRLKPAGTRALHESALVSRRVCDRIEGTWGRKVWNAGPA